MGLSITFSKQTKEIPEELDIEIQQIQLDLKKNSIDLNKHETIIKILEYGVIYHKNKIK